MANNSNTTENDVDNKKEALLSLWKEEHEYQIKDGCASAVIKAILNVAKIGREITQEDIQDKVYTLPPWDGSKPEDVKGYLKEYFNDVDYLEEVDLQDVKKAIEDGKWVIVLWTDSLPESDRPEPEKYSSSEDGHYSILAFVDKKYVHLVDPSNSERVYTLDGVVLTKINPSENNVFIRRAIYKITIQEFERRWHDIVDENGRVANHPVIIVDPNSVKKQ